MIKDKLIYNDIYDIIDKQMSPFQVGSRKQRNIRNNLFIVYSVINSVLQNESPPMDLQVYDVKKAFDSLNVEECCNDLYENGINDDKLAMIYEGCKENTISIDTPVGMTSKISIPDIVAQGGVLGSLMCSVQIDNISREALNRDTFIYY